MRHLDQNRSAMKDADVNTLLAGSVNRHEGFKEDLYAVIVDRTKGEAAVKVRNDTIKGKAEGNGVSTFMVLYLWYSSASGLAVQERLRRVMTPSSPKKVEDISPVLEAWVKEVENLESFGPDFVLASGFRILSLKIIMACKPDIFDSYLAKVKESESNVEGQYVKLLQLIQDYVGQKRLDDQFFRGVVPMDVSHVTPPSHAPSQPSPHPGSEPPYGWQPPPAVPSDSQYQRPEAGWGHYGRQDEEPPSGQEHPPEDPWAQSVDALSSR